MHILFYVSGHGFGHARRTAAIVAAMLRRYPAVDASVRTTAPGSIFTAVGLRPERISVANLDTGVVERDVLHIDGAQTVARLRQLMTQREHLIESEATFVRSIGATLIAADIPFLAGPIAEKVGIPSVALGNFTWDWICEPFLAEVPDGDQLSAGIKADYGKMTAILRQPFSHPMPQFKQVIDVPLVAYRSNLGSREILHRAGLDATDPRPRVLIGMRGGISPDALLAGVCESPNILFTTVQPLADNTIPNLRKISQEGLDFADLLTVHDAVISKLGYGIVSDSIAARTRLLWPRRFGFREDAMFEEQEPTHLCMREISGEDYNAGNWAQSLNALLEQPIPAKVIDCAGDERTAAELMQF